MLKPLPASGCVPPLIKNIVLLLMSVLIGVVKPDAPMAVTDGGPPSDAGLG